MHDTSEHAHGACECADTKANAWSEHAEKVGDEAYKHARQSGDWVREKVRGAGDEL